MLYIMFRQIRKEKPTDVINVKNLTTLQRSATATISVDSVFRIMITDLVNRIIKKNV